VTDPRFDSWLDSLQIRHLADLRFSEVTRALRALSARYVERRGRLTEHGAFDSAGKRAAYALYYSPIHFMTVARIVKALGATQSPGLRLVDLGCGPGAAGAAWASQVTRSTLVGIDSYPWAIAEAAATYRAFGLAHETRRANAARIALPRSANAIVAGWMLNELDVDSRRSMRTKLLQASREGVAVLIVEPISGRISPWWNEWADEFRRVGGRADEWRFPVELPEIVQRLDRAAGMDHEELKARSIYVGSGLRPHAES
jgi:hypothetical protein